VPGRQFRVDADNLLGPAAESPDSQAMNPRLRAGGHARAVTVVAAQSAESQAMNARIRAGAEQAGEPRQPASTPPAAPDRRSMNEIIRAGARRRSPGADSGASMTDLIRAAAGRPAKPSDEEDR
jgi:hypothetical protein